ncbi:rna-directed dna polymerase from mobile element jockey-like protein, partial [Dinothrombium tinctorium]
IGFKTNSILLLKSYLKSRFQYIEELNRKSKLECIKKGVPQGSILGPLPFILYINDVKDLKIDKIKEK